MKTNWIMLGAIWGALGVALGAFGAHGLEKIAEPDEIALWETAALYHLLHAPVLVLYGLFRDHRPGNEAGGWSLVLGSLIFSGTLYAMGLGAPRWLGAITPIGGTALIVGWLLFAWQASGSRVHGTRT